MSRRTLVALACLALAAPSRAGQTQHPLSGNDHLLPPFATASDAGPQALFANPSLLAMRPGEVALSSWWGLRGGTDVAELESSFQRRFSEHWSLAGSAGAGRFVLGLGLDRGRDVAGYRYSEMPGEAPQALERRLWRASVGLARRFVVERWRAEFAVGAAYRRTVSEALALDGLSSVDLGLVSRWGRWLSLGLSARDLNRPSLWPLSASSPREVAPNYRTGLALRPGIPWITLSSDMDLYEGEGGDWRQTTHYGLDASWRGRLGLRLDWNDERRFRAALFLSEGGWQTGAALGNQDSASKGTQIGSALMEWRSRPFGESLRRDRAFLDLVLAGEPSAGDPGGRVARAEAQDPLDLLRALREARRRPELAGVLLRLARPRLELAEAEALREALLGYRAATGKSVIVYAERYDLTSYYLATAGSYVLLHPAGELEAGDLALERLQADRVLAQRGLAPRYLAAAKGFAPLASLDAAAPRAELDDAEAGILRARIDLVLAAIGQARGLGRYDSELALSRGRYGASEALGAGLVDRLASGDQIDPFLKTLAGSARRLDAGELQRSQSGRRHWGSRAALALISAEGILVDGDGGTGLLGREAGIDALARALARARQDDRIRGICLYMDSPGGGALACERLRRELLLAALRKPLVVSLGERGAGGAYLAALPATRILAGAATRTGGLGPLGGKMLAGDGWTGILGGPAGGPRAWASSPWHDLSAAQEQDLARALAAAQAEQSAALAAARHISEAEADWCLRGRPMSGPEALERRLIDGIGGLEAALADLAELAVLPADEEPELIRLDEREPGAPSLMARLLARLAGPSRPSAARDAAPSGSGLPFAGESMLLLDPGLIDPAPFLPSAPAPAAPAGAP